MSSSQKTFIKILFSWLILSTLVITFITFNNPVVRAVIGMGWGVIFLWIITCGGLMYKFREEIRNSVLKINMKWQIKFVLFVTILALIEEAITTTMTNLSPLFGVPMGTAYITASTNFVDVVIFHSIINFVGPFIFWALALKRYDFSPFSAFIIFGVTGLLAEVSFSGPQSILQFGFWIFVYGLMIYLPTYSLPRAEERGAKKPRLYMYAFMVLLPLIFVPLFAWIPK